MPPMDQFRSRHGAGRIALTAGGLALLFGSHAVILATTTSPLARQWAAYVMAMCAFHFLEFVWACACVGMGKHGLQGWMRMQMLQRAPH